MKLSVIIPCRNAAKTIEAQLDALCHQQWHGGWEVIVADNGSTDGTQDVVACFHGRLPGLRLIDASARRGAAHARNAAVKESSGEALAFCDADDEVGIGWLTAMGNALTRYDFVASRMDVDKLNPAWLAVTLNNVQGKELRRAYYPPFLFHAGSSGMGVKRELHDRVDGFDETLREREDTDYCFRIQLEGVVLHFRSGCADPYPLQRIVKLCFAKRANGRAIRYCFTSATAKVCRWIDPGVLIYKLGAT